jgi:hypothetical protein
MTKEVVADRIQIARRTVYALMGAGLHGLSGLNPRASIHLINCYKVTSSATVGTPQKIEPIRAPSFSVS